MSRETESDVILLEYDKRLERRKKELKDFGFDEAYLDGKRLMELTTLLTDAREEAFKRGKTLETIKKEKALSFQKQLQLEKEKLYQVETEQKRQIQELQDKQELKQLMNDISKAEVNSEPKTLPNPEEVPILDDAVLEPCFSYDAWGKKEFSMKRRI